MNKDLNFGLQQEDKLLPLIVSKYGDDIFKTDKMCRWDYESDTILIELKSRRVKKNTYPTTMIGKTKVDLMLNNGKRVIAIFKFLDGTFEIEITKEITGKFDIREGGRCDRGRPELNQYYYIPIELLKDF